MRYILGYVFFTVLACLLSCLQTSAQTELTFHKRVSILPAFYFDNADTTKLNEQSGKLKLIGTFKKEIGRDVQYKFYMPLMLNAAKYTTYFRGVDTINKLIFFDSLDWSIEGLSDFTSFAQSLQSDALIVLELRETAVNYKGTNRSIISYLLSRKSFFPDDVIYGSQLAEKLNTYTTALTLRAKIIDGVTGRILWSKTSTVSNMYYHDAVNKMANQISKKLPYILKRRYM
jgi:hypothetical protein